MTRAQQVRRIRFYMLAGLALGLCCFWPDLALYLFAGFAWVPLGLFKPVFAASCTLFSDDFSTDQTATAWHINSGTFAVSGGNLTATANGIIRCETALGAGATGAHATVSMTFTGSETGWLILGYVDDNNYWAAQLTANVGGSGDGQAKLFQQVAGAFTQKSTTKTVSGLGAGETAQVCFSIGDGFARVNVSSATASAVFIEVATSASMASTKAALRASNIGTSISFDDFVFKTHYADDKTTPCNTCIGACDTICIDSAIPGQVQVTIIGVVDANCTTHNCAASLNTTFTLTYTVDSCRWGATGPNICGIPGGSGLLSVIPKTTDATHYPASSYMFQTNYDGIPCVPSNGQDCLATFAATETYPTDCIATHSGLTCTQYCNTSVLPVNPCKFSAATVSIAPL